MIDTYSLSVLSFETINLKTYHVRKNILKTLDNDI